MTLEYFLYIAKYISIGFIIGCIFGNIVFSILKKTISIVDKR